MITTMQLLITLAYTVAGHKVNKKQANDYQYPDGFFKKPSEYLI